MGVMHFFRKAQPALLYLSPACVGAVVFVAWTRGEVREAWEWCEGEKEEDEENEKEKKVPKEVGNGDKFDKGEEEENGGRRRSRRSVK